MISMKLRQEICFEDLQMQLQYPCMFSNETGMLYCNETPGRNISMIVSFPGPTGTRLISMSNCKCVFCNNVHALAISAFEMLNKWNLFLPLSFPHPHTIQHTCTHTHTPHTAHMHAHTAHMALIAVLEAVKSVTSHQRRSCWTTGTWATQNDIVGTV